MLLPSDIPIALQDLVQRELEPGERVEWTGMPKARYFNAGATAVFLFGIPWTAFAIFWTAAAAGWGVPNRGAGPGLFNLFFPLFGVPFILVGFGMLSMPYWAYRAALSTVYVITDRRAITLQGGRSTTIRSYPPDKLTDIYRKERRDGSGDVIVNRRAWRDSDGDRHSEELGFLDIPNVKEIEDRLKRLGELAKPA